MSITYARLFSERAQRRSHFKLDHYQKIATEANQRGGFILAQALDARFNVDFIDADAIERSGIPYRVLILPGVDRLPVAEHRKIEEFALQGGTVTATRRLPSTAPGLPGAERESTEIRAISERLFRQPGAVAASWRRMKTGGHAASSRQTRLRALAFCRGGGNSITLSFC